MINRTMAEIYRGFFKATSKCSDRSLKLYIRRRIREDFRANLNADAAQVDQLLSKAQGEL